MELITNFAIQTFFTTSMKLFIKKYLSILILTVLFEVIAVGQKHGSDTVNPFLTYTNPQAFYQVEPLLTPVNREYPKNVILLIGDGMGISNISAAMVANRGSLYINLLTNIGFTTTHSASDFLTDSGAGGTALASGQKTYNGAIGFNKDTVAIGNIREALAGQGLSTGVVATSSVTHATPASFVAHQPDRELHDAIAYDFIRSGIDLFIGGGLQFFSTRADGLNLIDSLISRGYTVDTTRLSNTTDYVFEKLEDAKKFAGLYAKDHLDPKDSGRGDFLPSATKAAIEFLNRNTEGFFLMTEGSQIDWGGHDKNTSYVISEMLDFDKAVGEALRFASQDGNTLVIVTSDHETGGFALHEGCYETGRVTGKFTSDDHTGSLVPVFAYGPGAHLFNGFYDNTDIPLKILQAMKIGVQ